MKKVIKYKHHGTNVSVMEHLKGLHREHCLCLNGCKWFRPEQEQNCKIAQMVYVMCVKYHIVTPVWECKKYKEKNLGELIADERACIIKNSMTQQQFIDKYGKRAWNKFAKWMIGQTCAVIGNETYYYNCDIERFLFRLPVID